MFLVPDFKGFDFFPHDTHIRFMRLKNVCFFLSVAVMIASLALFFTKGLNFGVDFRGGSLIELQHKNGPADLATIREKISALQLGDVAIQRFGTPEDVLIKVAEQPGGDEAQQAAMEKVTGALGKDYEQRRVEVVGPVVSSELRRTGTIAVLCAILAIIAYVWFRFEWQFAIGAVVALTHDVLITIGVFSLFNLDFDLSTVAALLTILGYSVNDTVVVADRIRENLRKYKKMEIDKLLDLSINETLSRTVLTSGTTIIVLLALYFLGGEVIRTFIFAMLFGIVIGTYSSIFIGAPVLDYLGVSRESIVAASEKKKIQRA